MADMTAEGTYTPEIMEWAKQELEIDRLLARVEELEHECEIHFNARAKLLGRTKRLEEALRPFALTAEDWERYGLNRIDDYALTPTFTYDGADHIRIAYVTAGDFRRAHAVLAALREDQDG
jgi:hypothetical protein